MLYKITIFIVRVLLLILNGFQKYEGQENLPSDKGYVLVAPHRSWLDPVLLAIAIYPKPVVVMAKQELFKPKPFAWFIKKLGAFPVNREKPSPSVIKHPVKELKEKQKALIIFPTGTRYSQDLKGGAITIAKLSKTTLVPAVYQGPFTLKEVLLRKKMTVRIGTPIDVSQAKKEDYPMIEQAMQEQFDTLDQLINPDFVYTTPTKQ